MNYFIMKDFYVPNYNYFILHMGRFIGTNTKLSCKPFIEKASVLDILVIYYLYYSAVNNCYVHNFIQRKITI